MPDPQPRHVQNFIANAFSISIIRRMAEKGALERIRSFLKGIRLGELGPAEAYGLTLDEMTERLQTQCQVDWGVARKCLNLFLRDVLYNVYLRAEYHLTDYEPYLEIPLDGFVGKELKKRDDALPRWKTVKGLTPDDSSKFQAAAQRIAERDGTYRVHLDIIYWRGGS